MPLSPKAKARLLSVFAITPILQRFALPSLIGGALFAAGTWRELPWLRAIGAILAAPILWAYALLIFVYLPFLLIDAARRALSKAPPEGDATATARRGDPKP